MHAHAHAHVVAASHPRIRLQPRMRVLAGPAVGVAVPAVVEHQLRVHVLRHTALPRHTRSAGALPRSRPCTRPAPTPTLQPLCARTNHATALRPHQPCNRSAPACAPATASLPPLPHPCALPPLLTPCQPPANPLLTPCCRHRCTTPRPSTGGARCSRRARCCSPLHASWLTLALALALTLSLNLTPTLILTRCSSPPSATPWRSACTSRWSSPWSPSSRGSEPEMRVIATKLNVYIESGRVGRSWCNVVFVRVAVC